MEATTPVTESPAATNHGTSLPRWVVPTLVAWPIAVVAAAGLYVAFEVRKVRSEVEARPPLAIIDVNREVMKRIEANPTGGASAATQHVYDMGVKLAKSGYIVINSNSVVAFPEEYGVAQ